MILFTADWHLKLGQKNVPLPWACARFDMFFEKIYELESQVDMHIIGGDLFDRVPSMDELTLYFDFVRGVKIPTIIYDGNHEATKKYKTFFSNLKRATQDVNPLVEIIDETTEYEWGTILPYVDLHRKGGIEECNPNKPLYTHVRGEIPPHVTPEVDLSRFSAFPVVYAGDLHSHTNTQLNIVYPGSPMTTSFHRNTVETGYLMIDKHRDKHLPPWTWHKFDLPQLLRQTVTDPADMIPTDFHHTIYEIEGDVADLATVKNSELLDKKVIKRNSESTLNLKEMTMDEELVEYLSAILNLTDDKIQNIMGVFNDYSKTLQWDNCFSYGKGNILDLNDSNLTQLVGTNGMGKSSIPLIIEEVLFNKNSKGIKKQEIQNRFIKDGYWINLQFEVDDIEYEIDVTRKASIKCKLYKAGEDISSHTATNTYNTVQNLLGLDFKTFTQLVYQNTNTSLQFLTATDTNRKKFLIDLLKLEEYVEFFEIFKEASREITLEINSLNSKCDTIVKWLEENKLESINILPILNLPKISESDETQLGSLRNDFEKISETNKKIIDNNFIKENLAELESNDFRTPVEEEISTTAMLQQLGTFSSKEAEAQAHMDKLDTLDDRCPTCEQEIDGEKLEELNLDYLNARTNAHNNQVVLKEQIANANKHNKNVIIARNLQRQYEDYIRDLDTSLPSQILDGDELSSKIDEISSRITQVKRDIEKIAADNIVAERHNTRLDIIQEQTESFELELEEIVAALGKVEETSAHLEILKKAFSTNGLLAYKIENLVKDLENLTNEYLAELSDGRFSLEFVVTNDKLNVEITDNANVVDILALSSGELARVNTATLLAIRKLMSSISSSQINTLFLDEVIAVLDDQGREKLVEILLEETLNTYIVSHGWTHPLLAKIEVIKEDNISRLE